MVQLGHDRNHISFPFIAFGSNSCDVWCHSKRCCNSIKSSISYYDACFCHLFRNDFTSTIIRKRTFQNENSMKSSKRVQKSWYVLWLAKSTFRWLVGEKDKTVRVAFSLCPKISWLCIQLGSHLHILVSSNGKHVWTYAWFYSYFSRYDSRIFDLSKNSSQQILEAFTRMLGMVPWIFSSCYGRERR